MSNWDLDATFWIMCAVVWVVGGLVALVVLSVQRRQRRAAAEPQRSPAVVDLPTQRRAATDETWTSPPAPVRDEPLVP